MSLKELPQLRVVASHARAVRPTDRASVEIYRPFFVAGIVSVLSAGCLLGAVALLGIALNASYTASAWAPYILAHANSQLFGWVGFFVMGFSLQQHAPTVAKVRLFHRLAYGSMILMGLGIALRFVAEPLSAVDHGVWVPIGIGSGLIQIAAVMVFLFNLTYSRHRRSGGLTWPSVFVFTSLFWLLAVSVAEPIYFAHSHSTNPSDRIMFVAQWFPPYREAQFLGFVAMMIFGVALVKMNSCFGAPEACPRLGMAGFAIWTAGLLLRMGGWVYGFRENLAASAMVPYHLGGILLGVGAVLLIASSRMFGPLEFAAPAQKFVRAAFAWLVVAGLLMAFEPLHLAAIGQPFSHAFTGAIRHAATVGFISQMILGVGMHVAARMTDLPRDLERPLRMTFWLLNIGNAGRVGLEIATDYTQAAFLPMGVTGFVELTALIFWAAYVLRTMFRRWSPAHVG